MTPTVTNKDFLQLLRLGWTKQKMRTTQKISIFLTPNQLKYWAMERLVAPLIRVPLEVQA